MASPMRLLLAVVFCAATPVVSASTARAQIDANLFELEGNTVEDFADASPVPGDDWQTLNPPPEGGAPGGSIARAYVHDPGAPNVTFNRGSKDTQNVSRWRWAPISNLLSKNDILNAYAAGYLDASGDLVLVFGLDRLSTDGAAAVGFWFFQQDVATREDGTFGGEHVNNDVLVTAEFSGSGVDEIRVFQWLDGGLVDVTPGGTADCTDGGLGGAGCGETNLETIAIDWTFQSKESATPGQAPPGSFFEGAINFSQIFAGVPVPCFSSFMATSRTSPSPTASIKNFVFGDFDLCNFSVNNKCEVVELLDPGSATTDPRFRVEFTATAVNEGPGYFEATDRIVLLGDAGDGFGNGNDVTVTRTIGDLTHEPPERPQPDGDGSDGFGAGESLRVYASGLSITGSFETSLNPPTSRVKAHIEDSSGEFIAGADVFGVECTPLDLTADLHLEKSCQDVLLTTVDPVTGGSLSHVGLDVGYDIRVCNTSSFALSDVRLSDPTAGVDDTVDLDPGLLCADGLLPCPEGSVCVGQDTSGPNGPVLGVCVFEGSRELGPDGQEGLAAVCKAASGRYLVRSLPGDATCAAASGTSLANTATARSPAASNPLLGADIVDMKSDSCGVCDDSASCPALP